MSGPVQKSDEMLSADANGAGRTPVGRPAVPRLACSKCAGLTGEVFNECGASCECDCHSGWTFRYERGHNVADLISPAGRLIGNIYPDDAANLCSLLNVGLEARRRASVLPSVLNLPEQSREHVRNALEMLTNGGDDKFLIGNERRVVYDAGAIEAVKARLLKALGRP